MTTGVGASWLAQTKLAPPPLRADTIARPRLHEALRRAVSGHRLTLVSAPAGYGKTTLLAALAQVCPDFALAWLALDADDNDPARFLAALVGALRRRYPSCGATTQALLTGLPNPGAEARRVVGVLINDVLATVDDPCALVLDDLHVVTEPAVYVALDYLLEHLPPQLRLVIATRHDPPLALARLRARRQVAELRLPDLRFTREEAQQFLDEVAGLPLSDEQRATLHAHTEGWAAGLSLVASALDRLPLAADRATLLAHLAGTDRYVFDFLAEEVLGHQEPGVRAFLLATAILDELTPALCAAVTGRADAAAVLESLYRRNLFVLGVDAAGTIFRYHDLFKEFLRERLAGELPPEEVRELHRRAAAAETIPVRAIRHLLAAGEWGAAARAIEAIGEDLLTRGELETLRRWSAALPAEVRAAHPRLDYYLGVAAWESWQPHEAWARFEQASRGFEAAGDAAGQGESLGYLAAILAGSGDPVEVAALFARALAAPLPPRGLAQTLVSRAWEELRHGRWERSGADLDAALDAVEAAGDRRALQALVAQYHQPYVALPGGAARVERLARLATRLGEDDGPVRAGVERLLTWVRLARGEWPEALEAAGRALAISERFGHLFMVELDVRSFLALYHALRGDGAAADRYLSEVLRGLEEPAFAPLRGPWLAPFLYRPGQVHLLRGRLDDARAVYARMVAATNPQEWPLADFARALLHGRLALAEDRAADAECALREALAIQRASPASAVLGDAGGVLARLLLDQVRPDEALAILAPVLAAHEREGTPGALLREGPDLVEPPMRLAIARGVHAAFARRVLECGGSLAGDRAPVATDGSGDGALVVPETGEALTPREVEVLRLIAAGAGNAAIAEQLFISVHTVKRHVAHLFAKLAVDSRTQAAARARELGLV